MTWTEEELKEAGWWFKWTFKVQVLVLSVRTKTLSHQELGPVEAKTQTNQRLRTDRGHGLQPDQCRNNKRGLERGSGMNRS